MGALTDKYIPHLLNQFDESSKLISFIGVFFKRLEDTEQVLIYLRDERFIDNAAGVWLDIIGAKVGMYPRPHLPETDNIFTYRDVSDPNDPTKGYGTHTGPTGNYGRYNSIHGLWSDTPISDEAYREWIKWKIDMSLNPADVVSQWEFIDRFTTIVGFTVDTILSDPTIPVRTVRVSVPLGSPQTDMAIIRKYFPLQAGYRMDLVQV